MVAIADREGVVGARHFWLETRETCGENRPSVMCCENSREDSIAIPWTSVFHKRYGRSRPLDPRFVEEYNRFGSIQREDVDAVGRGPMP